MAPTITNHPPQPPPSGIPDRASSADNSIRTRQPFKPDSKTTQCHKRGKVLDCLLIVVDVSLRNLGMQPPAYTVALTEYSLLYMTMAAAPWLVRERAWIVVEVLYRRTGPALRAKMDKLIFGLCALVSVVVAVLAGILAVEGALRGEVEMRSLDMPRWALFLPVTVGFAMMAVEFLRCLLRGDSMSRAEAEQAF